MKSKKIIIAGGTGFIGEEMIRYFGKDNHLIILSRQMINTLNNRNKYYSLSGTDLKNVQYIKWDGINTGDWEAQLDGADIVINLAGKSVNCRYTQKNRQEIFDSRTDSVNALGKAISKCKKPAELWINASSATIYRDAMDRRQDEYTGEYHNDFSVQVCKKWEKTLYEQETPYTRKIALRMAITLGSGGVLIPYFNLLKFGLGGRQGSGNQMYSWVHAEDTCRMIEWLYEHKHLSGIFNCCSPNPVSNAEFMRLLRKSTRHAFGLPAYEWMLKLGAPLIGTEAELVLKSRWVVPTKIIETGFRFKYPLLKDALADIIKRVPRRQYHLF
ncbi:MAG: TIGR01777 family oxidoreductase [Agriterribacter sp.]